MRTPRLGKSWAITLLFGLLAAAAPVFNDTVEPYGIVITEAEMQHLLTAFGLAGGLGVGNAVRKNVAHRQPEEPDVDEELLDMMPDTPPPPERQ